MLNDGEQNVLIYSLITEDLCVLLAVVKKKEAAGFRPRVNPG